MNKGFLPVGEFVGKTTPWIYMEDKAAADSLTKKKETATKTPAPEYVKALFAFFLTRYEPATKGPDVLKKTTVEIFEELQLHCPSIFYTSQDVYEFLIANQFTFDTPGGDLAFVWMMKYKQQL